MIDAVLWDNDGVLVDTETRFFEVTQSAFARLGLTLTKQLWGAQYMTEGQSSKEIAIALGGDPAKVAQMIDERNQEYRRVLHQPPRIRPQVRETLTALFGRVRLAVVTGCDRDQLHLMHESTGLLAFFELIVTGDQCAKVKPDPELYLMALQTLGVRAERCIAIEDSPRGLASARAAGVPCIVVPTDLTRGLYFPGALALEQDISAIIKHTRDQQIE